MRTGTRARSAGLLARAGLLAAALAASGARADDLPPCPLGGAEPQWGPPSEISHIRVGATLFRVPGAYVNAGSSEPGCVRERAIGLEFEFWMPDGQPLAPGTHLAATFRPRSPDRPEPGQDEFRVFVTELQFVGLNDPGYISPARRSRNAIGSAGEDAYEFEDEFGLQRFQRRDGRGSFLYYRSPPGADPQVGVSCTRLDEASVNPLCRAYIYSGADRLGFFYAFPRDALASWHATAQTARRLALGWRKGP